MRIPEIGSIVLSRPHLRYPQLYQPLYWYLWDGQLWIFCICICICRCICKCIYVVGYEMCLYFFIPKYQPLCSQTAPSPLYLWTIPFTLNVSYCQSDIGETGAPPTKVTKSWKPLFNCPISFEIVRTSHW